MKRYPVAFLIFFSVFAHASNSPDFDWDKPVDASVLQKLQTKAGLRVLWWNVHDGMIAPGDTGAAFNHNIDELIQSTIAPDVLSLAEFQESNLNTKVLKKLQKSYPYHILQAYPGTPGFGIWVYSKYSFEMSSIDLLDFTPLKNMSDSDRADYRKLWCKTSGMCVRPLMILDLNVNGKVVKLAPIHLFDCWRMMMSKVGKVGTLKEILNGTDNPLWYQILRFRQVLESRLGSDLKLGKVAVFGDFNMPEKLLGFPTVGFQKIRGELKNAIAGEAASFPSSGSSEAGHFPPMQIDHAFTSPSQGVSAGEVLPLKGSDHYPLYLIVQ